ncbi:MAG: flagellar basal body P-ring formation chaperone FlgA [Hyphomicrobium sp.]
MLVACSLVLSLAPAALAQVVLPVPRVTVYPGDVITDAMLIDKSFRGPDFEGPGYARTREALIGKVARSTLLPNLPVSMSGLREPFAVQQGQAATVFFQSGALIITTTAVSLQSASVGEVISLRNTDSGTTIRGIVQADGTVRVGQP